MEEETIIEQAVQPTTDIDKKIITAKPDAAVAMLQSGRMTPSPEVEKYKKQLEPTKHLVYDHSVRPDKLVKTDEAVDMNSIPQENRLLDLGQKNRTANVRPEPVSRIAVSLQELIVKRAVSFLFGNTVYYSFNRLINGSQYSSEASEYFSIIVMQLPAVTAMISLFVFLSFVIRKSSVFNLFALVVPLAYSSLIGLLTLFDSTKEFAQQYMTRLDFSNVFQDIAGRVDMTYIVKIITSCIILTILFFFAGLRIYNRSEAVQ